MKNMFKNAFVTLKDDFAKLSMDGKIAIRVYDSSDYKAYDIETKKLIDCTDFCIDLPKNAFFTVPVKVTDLAIGDIIIANGFDLRNVNCVTNVKDGEITVINFTSGKKEIVLPQYFFFMKDTAYVIKVVNLFGNMFNGIGQTNDMAKYFMMSQMMNNDDDNSNMLPMMFMMNGGNFGVDNDMMKYFMLTKMTGGKDGNMLPIMFMMNGGNFGFDNLFGNNTKETKTKSK